MSITAKLYIAVVISSGAIALVHGLSAWNGQSLVPFYCYLALAIPASCLKISLPGVTGTMSVLSLFLLAGVVHLGIGQTLVIGVACVVVQSLWRTRLRPQMVQVLFSVADNVLAITAAFYAYHITTAFGLQLKTPFRLVVAGSVFFVINTALIAVVIALTENKSLRQVWNDCYKWSYPYYLAGAAMVGGFMYVSRTFDWQVWLLILPVVYVIYRSYRLHVDQLQAARTSAEQQRTHSNEIAGLHAKTVVALESAIAANARLDAVIQALPLATLALDRSGNVISWNRMAEAIFGWTSVEAIGSPPPFAKGKSEQVIHDVIDRSVRGELVSGLETTQQRRDGSSCEIAIWTATLESRAAILMMAADISDRKQLEEQLRLSQKLEAVGRLAAGIAHDFNNLLTIINGYACMLTESLTPDSPENGHAEEILTAGNRAAELVSRILMFSRRQIVQPKPLDINPLVLGIERMLRRIITENIELAIALESEAGWIQADLNQMESVLLNLATNARDAMPTGGLLSIETARVEVTAADLKAGFAEIALGSYVRLIVTDTGQGMDTHTLKHLFDPFFTTKEIGKGTGLGLSSVYGIVQEHHGCIHVASEVGRGSMFSIYLPRLNPPSPAEFPISTPRGTSRGSETILLVEDENALRRMLVEALNRTGYRVWEAASGGEAMRKFSKQIAQVDLLVTDIVMPVMNGLQLAKELRSRHPSLKVVFMSGHAVELIRLQDGIERMPELLQKPFVPDALVDRVRNVLDASADQVSCG